MANLSTPLRPSRRDAIISLLAEELAAARKVHANAARTQTADLFAAGVADGMMTAARWLGVIDEVEERAATLER